MRQSAIDKYLSMDDGDTTFGRVKQAITRIRQIAQDAAETTGGPSTLEEHDRRFHPNGFDPNRDHCTSRDNLAKGDQADAIISDNTKDTHYSKSIEKAKALSQANSSVSSLLLLGRSEDWVRSDARMIVTMLEESKEAAKTLPREEFDKMMDLVDQRMGMDNVRHMTKRDYDWLWENAREEAMTLYRCFRISDTARILLGDVFSELPMYKGARS